MHRMVTELNRVLFCPLDRMEAASYVDDVLNLCYLFHRSCTERNFEILVLSFSSAREYIIMLSADYLYVYWFRK